jgi:hypothetical protein
MKNVSRCREYREGRIGFYHSYLCRVCGGRFRVFLSPGHTLAIGSRVCFTCEPNAGKDVISIKRR